MEQQAQPTNTHGLGREVVFMKEKPNEFFARVNRKPDLAAGISGSLCPV